MANNDTIKKTLIVAVSLCIVCSLVVSTAAVLLKPAQIANQEQDRMRNILAAAGLLQPGVSVQQQFDERVETRMVDLRTGRFTDEVSLDQGFDPLRSTRDPSMSMRLDRREDIAGIQSREHFRDVYLVRRDGELDRVILPVRGYGLWSTMHGFLALESDLNTVVGITFFEHGETPGLGGEIDNPRWKRLWEGKQVFRDGEVELTVVKGSVDPDSPMAEHRVDGLSGATLTSRGVANMIAFWLGDKGYKPFLNNLKAGEA